MPKVDFYILPTEDEKKIYHFVCQLAEKAYQQNHRIYFHLQNKQQAEQLDEILWTWQDDSFLPHNLIGEGPRPAPPIQIGYEKIPPTERDILINLSQYLPNEYGQFARILEVIPQNETAQAAARERYRIYREQNYILQTYKPEKVETL